LIGGIGFMYWMEFNMSIAVAVGFIALAGLAIEIGVLMLVYLNHSYAEMLDTAETTQQAWQETELRQAVLDGAALRVRPIMMTVLTVIIGLFPVMMGGGTGSEVMQRIAGPMVGGMASTLVLTLLVLPVIYFVWKRRALKHRVKNA